MNGNDNYLILIIIQIKLMLLQTPINTAQKTLIDFDINFFSGLLVTKIGCQKIAVVALVLYSVRLFGFTLMTSPELFLILEILKPLCTTLLILSVSNFVKDNSTMTSTATMQSIFGATHFGVGEIWSF